MITETILGLFIVLNIIFNFILVYVLGSKCDREGKIDLLYLLNLFCLNLINGLLSLIVFAVKKMNVEREVAKDLDESIMLIKGTFMHIMYSVNMVLILLDKILEITLNIRYHIVWGAETAKRVIVISWMIGAVVAVGGLLVHHIGHFRVMYYLREYLLLPSDIIYVTYAFTGNVYIFYKFRKSRMEPHSVGGSQTPRISLFSVFRKSRFFIPLIVISIYIVFHISPVMVLTLMPKRNTSQLVRHYVQISHNIALLFDALVCIFVHPVIRKKFKRFSRLLNVHKGFIAEQKNCLQHKNRDKTSRSVIMIECRTSNRTFENPAKFIYETSL